MLDRYDLDYLLANVDAVAATAAAVQVGSS
jgi:hypothetical protein